MRLIPYCVPEIVELVLDVARAVSDDAFIHKKVVSKILATLQEHNEEENQAELTLTCLRTAYQTLGVKDPYENEKARMNRTMLGLRNTFREYLDTANNPLLASVQLSISACGEAIRRLRREELESELWQRIKEAPAIDNSASLFDATQQAKKILFIASGAGEIIADKFLIEQLSKNANVEVVVAARPLLTRATLTDAETAEITKIAAVTDTGAEMLGTILDRVSTGFREKFMRADVVIAKGPFNFQTLNNCERDTFHLLRSECPAIAEQLKIPLNSGVVYWHQAKNN